MVPQGSILDPLILDMFVFGDDRASVAHMFLSLLRISNSLCMYASVRHPASGSLCTCIFIVVLF